jgi:hypothetical protein
LGVTFEYSIIEGSASWRSIFGTNGGHNTDTDPLFESSGSFRLSGNSPAIDAGSAAAFTEGLRPAISLLTSADITPDFKGAAPDLGAYEKQ